MIILTDEIFINIKKINSINVGCNTVGNAPTWFVQIQCMLANAEEGYEFYNGLVSCESKEKAYGVFKEIMKQVSDSDLVPELTNKLVDDVLSNKEKVK
jgi:hypothetical protein